MSKEPKRILVVANETVGGHALIEAVKEEAHAAHEEARPFQVTVICPQNHPKHGYVRYTESTRTAAESRLSTTIARLREAGIPAEGEVMDPDPYTAITDALGIYGADTIVISTYPATRSGWMRRDLVERVQEDTGLPVKHVVVDLAAEGDDVTHTLVVANQTVDSRTLIRRLKEKTAEGHHHFTVIVPRSDDSGEEAGKRLAHTLQELNDQGIEAEGQVMDPDPFTAIRNAMQFYPVDEILISTLPATRSGWLRGDLIQRVQAVSTQPVEHLEMDSEADEVPGARDRAGPPR